MKESLTSTGEDSSISNLMLSMPGPVAEFERAIRLERQREGIAKAKARGANKGRKPSLTQDQGTQLRQRVEAGEKETIPKRLEVQCQCDQ